VQGANSPFWKRRWFELSKGVFSFYKSQAVRSCPFVDGSGLTLLI
jgi:hypothetical protein